MVTKTKKVGRPTKYSILMAAKICSRLAEGQSLRTVCKEKGMPDKATVFVWLANHKEFNDQYAKAKEESTDAHLEMMQDLGDDAIALSQAVGEKRAGAVVQAVRLKADNLKWIMSKLKPKKYGDKLDVTTKGEKLPTPIYGSRATGK